MAQDMVPFGLGGIEVPGSWEVRTQITLLEPEEVIPIPPALGAGIVSRPPLPRPRANIVVSRQRAADNQTADGALRDFIQQAVREIPQLEILGEEPVRFEDEVEGASVRLTFDASGIRLGQRHVFRIDAEILTQIVVTVSEDRVDELEGDLLRMTASYSARR